MTLATNPEFSLDGELGEIGLADLLSMWRESDLCFGLKLVGANPHEPGLIGALRGTWGQHLIDAEAAGCTQAHQLLNIIFRDTLPSLSESGMIARPVVIETDIHTSGNVSIRIRCFGFSDYLISAIRKTFPEALKKGVWIRGFRFGVIVKDTTISRLESLPVPARRSPTQQLSLHFRSPYVTGKKHCSPDAITLLESLLRRVSGLCRWHGFKLAPDNDFIQTLSTLNIDMSKIVLQSWLRHSNRHNMRQPIVMIGFTGNLVISDPCKKTIQLVTLGAQCHAGARTAFGLGRYDIDFTQENLHS